MKVEVGALSWMAHTLPCHFSVVIQGKESWFHKYRKVVGLKNMCVSFFPPLTVGLCYLCYLCVPVIIFGIINIVST